MTRPERAAGGGEGRLPVHRYFLRATGSREGNRVHDDVRDKHRAVGTLPNAVRVRTRLKRPARFGGGPEVNIYMYTLRGDRNPCKHTTDSPTLPMTNDRKCPPPPGGKRLIETSAVRRTEEIRRNGHHSTVAASR